MALPVFEATLCRLADGGFSRPHTGAMSTRCIGDKSTLKLGMIVGDIVSGSIDALSEDLLFLSSLAERQPLARGVYHS